MPWGERAGERRGTGEALMDYIGQALFVTRHHRSVALRARTAAEGEQVIADRAHLRVGVAAQLRIRRLLLHVLRPERRHARAGPNRQTILPALQEPVGIESFR